MAPPRRLSAGWRAGGTILPSLAGCLLLNAAPALASPCSPTDLSGSWQRSHRSEDDAARDAEIERVTTSMNLVVRGIARTIMKRSMQAADRIEIGVTQDELRVRRDDDESEIPLGANISIHTTRDTCSIAETWANDASYGTTEWRLSRDRTRLTVHHIVHDPHFDSTLNYASRYRRPVSPQ